MKITANQEAMIYAIIALVLTLVLTCFFSANNNNLDGQPLSADGWAHLACAVLFGTFVYAVMAEEEEEEEVK